MAIMLPFIIVNLTESTNPECASQRLYDPKPYGHPGTSFPVLKVGRFEGRVLSEGDLLAVKPNTHNIHPTRRG